MGNYYVLSQEIRIIFIIKFDFTKFFKLFIIPFRGFVLKYVYMLQWRNSRLCNSSLREMSSKIKQYANWTWRFHNTWHVQYSCSLREVDNIFLSISWNVQEFCCSLRVMNCNVDQWEQQRPIQMYVFSIWSLYLTPHYLKKKTFSFNYWIWAF